LTWNSEERVKEGAVCAVYIMTNPRNTVLYTGVTSDLRWRVAQHKAKTDPHGFAARYNATTLVFFEMTPNIVAAIAREKQIKAGSRRKKIELISRTNPEWRDLSADWE
jgi:putative endonuclease